VTDDGVTSGGGGGGGRLGGGQGGGGAFDNDLIVNQAGMGGGGGGSSYGATGTDFDLVSETANPNNGSFNGGNGEITIQYTASGTSSTTTTTVAGGANTSNTSASVISGATTAHTGLAFAGSTLYVAGVGAFGLGLLALGERRRRSMSP